MNAWFGKSPWGICCYSMPHIETPTGDICYHCNEGIKANDEGQIISLRPIHRECLIRSLVGSLGHQKKQCSCYGGSEEDPLNLTKRQAAIVACKYFEDKEV